MENIGGHQPKKGVDTSNPPRGNYTISADDVLGFATHCYLNNISPTHTILEDWMKNQPY